MLRDLWTRFHDRPVRPDPGTCRRRRRRRALHRAHPLERLEPRLALAGLVVSNPSVNEASPYAVFVVKGTANEAVSLSLGGTATGGGVDYTSTMEWTTNGTTWTTYTSGTINLSAGDGEAFVRLPIVNDTPFDNGETIVLTVTPSVGSAATGTATLRDDGTGNTYDGTVAEPPLDASTLPAGDWRDLNFAKSRLMIASFHGAFYKASIGGYYVAGELASPTSTNLTTPKLVTPAEGYTYTGDIIDVVVAGGNAISQYAVLTTEGLWVWGAKNTMLPTALTPSSFSKVTLPADFSPRDALTMTATDGGLVILMRDGTVRTVVIDTRESGHANGDHFAQVRLTSATGPVLTGITDVEYSMNTAFAYSKSNNTFYTWGLNTLVGDGTIGFTSRPYAAAMANPLPAGVDVIQIGVTKATYFVLGSNGRIYTVGQNNTGAGGQGNTTTIWAWTTVKNTAGTGPLENVQFISTQNGGGNYASISAILEDGSLLAWGENNAGMIAIGVSQSTLPRVAQGSVNGEPMFAVENGGHFSLALNYGCDGEINATGHNPGGAFGDGTTGDRSTYGVNLFLGNIAGACTAPVGTSVLGTPAADDDRTVAVNDLTVNEGSPFAVFTVPVNAPAGTSVTLALGGGTATGGGTDYGAAGTVTTVGQSNLEYSLDGGTTWTRYTAPFVHTLTGAGVAAGLLVRTPIKNDIVFDDNETLQLTAGFAGSARSATGTATVKDDGTGQWFTGTSGTGSNSAPAGQFLDGDMPMVINHLVVNEGSPYAVWTVVYGAGKQVTLSLTDGTASVADDLLPYAGGHQLETSTDGGTTWVPYVAGGSVAIGGDSKLLVRVRVNNDVPYEVSEVLSLRVVQVTGGTVSAIAGTTTLKVDVVTSADVLVGTAGTNLLVNGEFDTYTGGNGTNTFWGPNQTVYTAPNVIDLAGWTETGGGTKTYGYLKYGGLYFGNSVWTATNLPTLNAGNNFVATGNPFFAPLSPRTTAEYGDNENPLAVSQTIATTVGATYRLQFTQMSEGYASGTGIAAVEIGGQRIYFAVPYVASAGRPYTFQFTADSTATTVRFMSWGHITTSTDELVLDGVKFNEVPSAVGTLTILDNAQGTYFDGASGAPITPPAPLDDDRGHNPVVNDVTVNEGSPYGVFNVVGLPGATVDLSVTSGTASTSADLSGLEWSTDGVNWSSTVTNAALDSNGSMLVRFVPTNDAVLEGSEAFTLVAVYSATQTVSGVNVGGTGSGIGTIKDDATGQWFDGTSGTGSNTAPVGSALDADWPGFSVNDVSVNEETGTMTFTVTKTGATNLSSTVNYTTAGGTATSGTDFTAATGTVSFLPGETTKTVTVTITNDTVYEFPEKLYLRLTGATNAVVVDGEGVGTILDESDRSRNPLVNSINVNEGSPYAIFTVTGLTGAAVTLAINANNDATIGNAASTDYGAQLQYYDAAFNAGAGGWRNYTAGNGIAIPAGGLLVRHTITNDTTYEGPEGYTLRATYNGTGGGTLGAASVGLCKITDDGTGSLFSATNTTGIPDAPGTNGAPAVLNDDRLVTITGFTVNEASPYGIFVVTGAAGQSVKLVPTDGTAKVASGTPPTDGTVDYGPGLQYFDGTTWQNYTPDSFVQIPAGGTKLLVRTAIVNDTVYELSEAFTLTASNTQGASATATGTITDDGTGSLFSATNTTGVPDAPGTNGAPATLNDDRPDSDGDGIRDYIDIDDDNDGVVDCDESVTVPLDFTGVGSNIVNRNVDPTGYTKFSATKITTGQEYGPAVGDASGMFATSVKAGVGNTAQYRMDFTRPTDLVIRNNLAHTGGGGGFVTYGEEYTFAVSGAPGATIALNDPAGELQIWNGSAWVAVPANYTATTIRWRLSQTIGTLAYGLGSFTFHAIDVTSLTYTQVNQSNTDNGVTFNIRANCVDIDTDADGIPNRLELNSDADSCSDASEAGTSTVPGATTVPGPYGSNGWADSVEAAGTTALPVTFTITTNTLSSASAGSSATTSQGVGAMSGKIMNGAVEVGQWYLANFRYTKKAVSATNTITGSTFTSATTGNPYGFGGVGVVMTVGDETTGIVSFSYDVRVAMNPGYRAESIYLLGKNPNSATYYGPALSTIPAPGGRIRASGFVDGTGTVSDPNNNLVAADGLTFTAGTNLQGYTGGEKLPADTTWSLTVPSAHPVLFSVDYSGQTKSSSNEATAFSVRVVEDPYTDKAIDPTKSVCGSAAPSVSITSVEVNEASPFAIVQVSLSEALTSDITFTPSLASGSGTVGTDTGATPSTAEIEYFDGTAWVSAAAGVTIPAGATSVLLRTAITPDTSPEGSEIVDIATGAISGGVVSNATGVTGTITIRDDAQGGLFGGSNSSGTPDTPGTNGLPVNLDDDRPLAVNDITVNEASPYGVFTVTGQPGQLVALALGNTTSGGDADALLGTDTGDAGSGVPLQVFNGTEWVDYAPGSFVAIPTGGTKLLVRTKITNDSPAVYEGPETFTLTATNVGGTPDTGVGTILDDGTGDIFPDNTTGNPDENAPRDDDRGLQIGDVTVNEGSPYAVFRLENPGSSPIDLASLAITAPGSGAAADLGPNPAIEIFDPTANGGAGGWVPFAAGTDVPANGELLVRVGITAERDLPYEGPEKFVLSAGITAGPTFSGTGTILDNGKGDIFPDNTTGNPDENAPKNDDRTLQIGDVTVNEGSPYAVFHVANPGLAAIDLATLAIVDPTTGVVADLGQNPAIEVFDPTANGGAGGWVPFVAGMDVPAGGEVLVRVDIGNEKDAPFEGPEKFLLAAGITAGPTFSGTGTILDDGKGDIFPDNTTGNPDENAPKEDDRTLQIGDVTVNEASPYAIFRLENPGASPIDLAALAIIDPTTGAAADLGANPTLEIFDPAANGGAGGWVPFAAGTDVPANGELLVRVGITAEQDAPFEGPEKFVLAATITSGPTSYGTGTILDDGKGDIFPDNTTGNPDENAPKNDDRALQIGDVTVNEASPYAVFRLENPGASPIDLAALAIIDPTTGVAADLGPNPAIEIFDPAANGGAGGWVPFTAGTDVPANGELLVRVGITAEQDAPFEGPEKFVLAATITNGPTSYGTGTILDDGKGDIFPDNTTGNPDENAPKNDDRVLQVNDVTVNEGSPYAVFRIENPSGQPIDLGSLTIIDPNTGVAADLGPNPALEIFDPAANGGVGGWVPFAAGTAVPASGELLVRVGITAERDAAFEGPEKFVLAAGILNGPTSYGTGTILDDGKGDYFPDSPTGNPDPEAPKDDDRRLQIDDVTVNEASPYAIFHLTNPGSSPIDLAGLVIIDPNTGVAADLGPNPSLEVFDPAANGGAGAWVPFTAGTDVPANGELLVRAGITAERDAPFEGPEKFVLAATITSGPTSYGTGTILDNGTGDLFGPSNTSGEPDAPGTDGLPPNRDDDRTLQIDDVTINEASPYAIFHLTNPGSAPIDLAALAIIDPNTGVAADLGAHPPLEVWDGAAWVPFAAGIDVPANGELLVRVGTTAEQDVPFEGPEKFVLAATITNGPTSYGIGTILDDGAGDLFGPSNSTGTPDAPGTDGLAPQRNDDRPLSVNDISVNEGSPYAVFTVTGVPGHRLALALGATTATTDVDAILGADTANAGATVPLQYFDGTAWVDYATGSFVAIPTGGSALLVRTKITNDSPTVFEGPETFTLTATTSTGTSATGTCTILDTGAGDLFSGSNTSGTPDAPGGQGDLPAALDDDRPAISISDVTVNEATDGFAEVTVTLSRASISPTTFTPSLASGTATVGTDTTATPSGAAIEYFDGEEWVSAAGGVTIPAGATSVKLRSAIAQDSDVETTEDYTITTGPVGGDVTNPTGVTGTVTIVEAPSIAVSSVMVNEGSPFAIVEVTLSGASGQPISFTPSLASNSATAGVDTKLAPSGAAIEYFDGTNWVSAATGATIPAGQTSLLLRVAVKADTDSEGLEELTIATGPITAGTVLNPTGTSGTIGIRDDAEGDLFSGDNTTGVHDHAGEAADLPLNLDDDRPLAVNSVTVNEASPYAVFTVTGVAGQLVSLALSNTSDPNDTDAILGTDTGNAGAAVPLQYFDGTNWVDYVPGSFVEIPAAGTTMLVRTKITNDSPAVFEGPEKFTLTATNTGGTPATGIGTIIDNGTGDLFSGTNTSGLPENPGTNGLPVNLDDDRPLAVNSVTVNEATPYILFTVTGQPGQLVSLVLGNTSDPNDTDAILGTDTGNAGAAVPLQYFDGTNWVDYVPGSFVEIPATGTTMLVRTKITNDSPVVFEGPETLTLTATNTGGTPATGIGTIIDNGTGDLFSGTNTSGLPDTPGTNGLPVNLDDDRPLAVNSVTVNEASPYAVFTVTGVAGQLVSLALGNTSDSSDVDAILGTDTANAGAAVPLQYFDGTNWVDYVPGSFVEIPAAGTTMLIRTKITNDSPAVFEGPEKFTLTATNTGGTPATGIGTIIDNGTGDLFSGTNTSGLPENPGTNGLPVRFDDDRPLAVNSVTVNEASPYAVFTVTGVAGQLVSLALGNTSDSSDVDAILGTDTANAGAAVPLQYFDGTNWVDYVPGSFVAIPASGTTMLVRTRITNDSPAVFEGPEKFTLTATNTGGAPATGIGTIIDNGTGSLFSGTNTSGLPDTPGTNGLPVNLDDDRPLAVNSVTVNEASPYAVFTVTGVAGQLVSLALSNTSDSSDVDAILGTDTANAGAAVPLQYFDGTDWVDYVPGSFVAIPATGTTMLVRTKITNDSPVVFEGPETFTLTATNTGGAPATGIGTIIDNGTGSLFSGANTSGLPETPGTNGLPAYLDDDRGIAINNVTVNEVSPYAVFRVSGFEGQSVSLWLTGGSAVLGTDFRDALQYFDGAAWRNYVPGTYVPFPVPAASALRVATASAGGPASLLVRVPIVQDSPYEISEGYTLQAALAGRAPAVGIGLILDNGTGDIFLPSNTSGIPDAPGTPGYPASLDDDMPLVVTATEADCGPGARIFVMNPFTGAVRYQFPVFESTFRGGARVAVGDVDGDGAQEVVVAPGPGRVGEIRVYEADGTELIGYRTQPFGAKYTGGVEVVAGDVDADGDDDLVAVASRGPGNTAVFRVTPTAGDPVENQPFKAYAAFDRKVTAGGTVAAADLNNDGRIEIIHGSGPGAAPRVNVFDVSAAVPRLVDSFAPFAGLRKYTGGVAVATTMFNNDAMPDILVAGGRGAGSVVEVYDGTVNARVANARLDSARLAAFADLASRNAAVYATAVDTDGDGVADRIFSTQAAGGVGVGIRSITTGGAAAGTFSAVSKNLRIATARPKRAL